MGQLSPGPEPPQLPRLEQIEQRSATCAEIQIHRRDGAFLYLTCAGMAKAELANPTT